MEIVCFQYKQQTCLIWICECVQLLLFTVNWWQQLFALLSRCSHKRESSEQQNGQPAHESAAMSAVHPAPLTNAHLSQAGKKKTRCHGYWQLLSSFSFSSPLTPSPPLSASIANDSSTMHACSLTGRAFEMYCYIAGVPLGVYIQLGLCRLYVLCCSPIRRGLCLKCKWNKHLQLWLRLRVWHPLWMMNTLHINLQTH